MNPSSSSTAGYKLFQQVMNGPDKNGQKSATGNMISEDGNGNNRKTNKKTKRHLKKRGRARTEQEAPECYEVEEILGKRMVNGECEYRILWKGYPESEASWEPVHNLQCSELQEKYEAAERQKRIEKRRRIHGDTWEPIPGEVLHNQESQNKRLKVTDENSGDPPVPVSDFDRKWELLTTQLNEMVLNMENPVDVFSQGEWKKYEKAAQTAEEIVLPNEEYYRKTAPKRVIRHVRNELGDPFVVMEWEDGFQCCVSFTCATAIYPGVFIPWMADYVKKHFRETAEKSVELLEIPNPGSVTNVTEQERLNPNASQWNELEGVLHAVPSGPSNAETSSNSEETVASRIGPHSPSKSGLHLTPRKPSRPNFVVKSVCAGKMVPIPFEIPPATADKAAPEEVPEESVPEAVVSRNLNPVRTDRAAPVIVPSAAVAAEPATSTESQDNPICPRLPTSPSKIPQPGSPAYNFKAEKLSRFVPLLTLIVKKLEPMSDRKDQLRRSKLLLEVASGSSPPASYALLDKCDDIICHSKNWLLREGGERAVAAFKDVDEFVADVDRGIEQPVSAKEPVPVPNVTARIISPEERAQQATRGPSVSSISADMRHVTPPRANPPAYTVVRNTLNLTNADTVAGSTPAPSAAALPHVQRIQTIGVAQPSYIIRQAIPRQLYSPRSVINRPSVVRNPTPQPQPTSSTSTPNVFRQNNPLMSVFPAALPSEYINRLRQMRMAVQAGNKARMPSRHPTTPVSVVAANAGVATVRPPSGQWGVRQARAPQMNPTQNLQPVRNASSSACAPAVAAAIWQRLALAAGSLERLPASAGPRPNIVPQRQPSPAAHSVRYASLTGTNQNHPIHRGPAPSGSASYSHISAALRAPGMYTGNNQGMARTAAISNATAQNTPQSLPQLRPLTAETSSLQRIKTPFARFRDEMMRHMIGEPTAEARAVIDKRLNLQWSRMTQEQRLPYATAFEMERKARMGDARMNAENACNLRATGGPSQH